MYECKVCGKQCKNLGAHVKTHNYNPKEYYDEFFKKGTIGVCTVCGKDTKFRSLSAGYGKYCSSKCSANSKETREKVEKTNIDKYGVPYLQQSKSIQEKTKLNNLEKYGVKNVAQHDDVKDKYKNTCLERFGETTNLKTEETKNKIKQTNLKKYSVEYPSQNKEIRNKAKETWIEKYGEDNPQKNKKIREKSIKTNLERYGVKFSFITDEIIKKRREEFYNKLLNSDRIKGSVPLFTLEEYINRKQLNSYRCLSCDNTFYDHLDNGNIPRCPICYPPLNGTSKGENELFEIINNLLPGEVIKGDRTVLENNRELDIYIPSKNLAIEFNGLYWHSLLQEKNQFYHLNKTIECKNKGITLIHIFEDEWFNKSDIVLSLIKNKLNLNNNRISARKCEIKKVNNLDAEDFLIENHLQGKINGIHFGLYLNDELISILSMGKSRFNKNYDYEILRFCNKINTTVNGGFSKLFNYFNKLYEPGSVITYVDKRYGSGSFYENCGFKYLKDSKPSFFYTNYYTRFNRQSFQKYKLKDKLEVFDEKLTAWENMQLNGYDKIFDCGNYIYILNGNE